MTYADVETEMNRVKSRRDNTPHVPPQQRIAQYMTALYKHDNYNNSAGRSGRTGSARGRVGSTGGQTSYNTSSYGRTGSARGRVGSTGRQRGYNTSSFDVCEKFNELSVNEETNNDDDDNGGIDFDAYEDIPVEVSGNDVPKDVKSFDEIDMCDALKVNVRRCKYVKPTPIQRHAIPIVVCGRDLMACAQTGSGKTAAFCFPIISGILKLGGGRASRRGGGDVARPLALILSPTRELTCQIHEEAKKFAFNTGIKIAVVYGGAPIYNQLRELKRGVDILVATPGRLVDMIDRGRVSLSRIKYLALDEADRMLDMGFEHQIRDIVEQKGMPPPGERQTLLFSATFPEQIQRLASDFLSNYIFLTVGRVGSSTELIEQKVVFVDDRNKRNSLIDIFRAQTGKPLTLVFVETKRGADALENYLLSNGLPAIAIHGDKIQMERERALKSFKRGLTPILVATDVASRGLDVPQVAHVINYDLPKGIDDYVHRIGRTGRAGRSGVATAFFNENNLPLAKDLVQLMQDAKQEVPSWLGDYAMDSFNAGYGARLQEQSKFGGYDFRSSYNTNNYGDATSFAADSASATYGYGTTANSSVVDSSSSCFGFAVAASDKGSSTDSTNFAVASTSTPAAADFGFTYPNIIPKCSSTDITNSVEASTSTAAADYGFTYANIIPTGWE